MLGAQPFGDGGPHCGAAALPALQQYGPAVVFGDTAHDRKPKAGALPQVTYIKAKKVTAEYGVQFVCLYAAAVVTNGDHNTVAAVDQAQADPAEPPGVDQTVGEQIQHQNLQHGGIGIDNDLFSGAHMELNIRPEHAYGVHQIGQKPGQLHGGQGDRQIFFQNALYDGNVGKQAHHGVMAFGQGGEAGGEGPVSQLIGFEPAFIRHNADVHQAVAHGADESVIHQHGRRFVGGKEYGLHVADPGHPQNIMPAHNRHIRHKGRGLGIGDDRAEQGLYTLAYAVFSQNVLRAAVGENQLAEPAQHCGLAGKGQNIGRDLDHTKQPPL